MIRTAVITIVSGRHEHLRNQHRALLRSTSLPDVRVVVAIDDEAVAGRSADDLRTYVVTTGSKDRGLPLAAARNLGARTAVDSGAQLLIFLDVDCLPSRDLVGAYAAAADDPATADHLLCGPVAYLPPPPDGGYDLDRLDELAPPHPARPAPAPGEVVVDPAGHRLFWSLSFALRSDVWDRIGGFDEAYVGYGGEDTDFGQRAAAHGMPIAWVGSARAHHQHHPVSDPPVEHVDDIVRNAAVFHRRWGWWPMQTWLDAFVERGLVVRDDTGAYVRPMVGTPQAPTKEQT